MEKRSVYQGLADAFASEGVRTQYALMGDGNMHMVTDMETRLGIETIHLRHEHCAVGAAMGHFSTTGEVGVASVTCGPGFTQTLTALVSAARGRIPLVLFAGEAPIAARYYHQYIAQPPLAVHCGARYIAVHALDRLHDNVREAFYVARTQRCPVVIGVPYDLQKKPMPDLGEYQPSTMFLPQARPVHPDPRAIADLAARLRAARAPVLVGGLGALHADAVPAIEALADRTGALLANTLPARGMFDHHPYSLGVCGGYARPASVEQFANADLVIAFGASLSYFTLYGGSVLPKAEIVQIALEPNGWHHGLRTAHSHIVADARLAAEALLAELGGASTASQARAPGLDRTLREARIGEIDNDIEAGTLNPVTVFEELEQSVPKDFHTISGTGHQSYFHTTMRGYDPRKYHHMRDFGAVGFSISQAIGVATAAQDGKVVLFDGDGSLMMYLGDLETIARHRLKLLIVCINDGGYGAEIHKLRADGLPVSGAIHGRPDFETLARGFGIRGATVREPGQLGRLIEEYHAGDTAMLIDVHVSDKVMSFSLRRNVAVGHGVR